MLPIDIGSILYNGSPLFPHGLCSAGNVYDEITPTKAIKRVGTIDLGNYTFGNYANISSSYPYGYTSMSPIDNFVYGNFDCTCNKYVKGYSFSINKSIIAGTHNGLYVIDDSLTGKTGAQLQTALSGVIVNYKLNTPIEVNIQSNLNYTTDSFGIEKVEPENVSTISTSPIVLVKDNSKLISNSSFGLTFSGESGDLLDSGFGEGRSSRNMSVCCWVKPLSSLDQKMILSMNYNSTNSFYLGVRSNTWNISYGPTGWGRTSNAPCTLNQWQHLCVTINSNGTANMYLNGVATNESITCANDFNFQSNIMIGGRNDGLNANCLIRDFRIYDFCLTDSDVSRVAQDKSFDLVPYDNLSWDRSGFVIDKKKEYNITYSNGSFVLNGSNSAIQIPFNKLIENNSVFTMNIWFYRESFGTKNWETIVGGPGGFEIETKQSSGTTPYIIAYSWGGNSANKFIPYNLNQWNMLTMTRNSSNIPKFYLNGVLVLTGAGASVPIGDFFIGAWKNYTGQNFKGKVKNFKVFKKVLTDNEIMDLYKEY